MSKIDVNTWDDGRRTKSKGESNTKVDVTEGAQVGKAIELDKKNCPPVDRIDSPADTNAALVASDDLLH